ncbi:MAG: putative plasmid stabilization protein [Tardiphaga sp.]|nr:putative plasmid stabilization protein [Tardiphaga sp.]
MRVIVTVKAKMDLIEIARYVAEDNPAAADAIVDRLQRECERMDTVPLRYPLVPRHEQLGIRRRPAGNYLIFYRVGRDAIDILRILHAARDYERLLSSE